MEKETIGTIEKVKINGHEILAKIDTGAIKNSINIKLASKLKLGPIIKTIKIISATGEEKRPVIRATLEIKGKKIKTFFNITDRSKLKYPVLIGLNTIKDRFLIDPSKK